MENKQNCQDGEKKAAKKQAELLDGFVTKAPTLIVPSDPKPGLNPEPWRGDPGPYAF